MKIQKMKNSKKIPFAIVCLVLVLGVGSYFIFAQLRNSSTDRKNETGKSFAAKSESDIEQSKNIDNDPSLKENTPNSDKPSAPVSNESKNTVQMIASVDTSTSAIYIRGGVNYPVKDGSCYSLLKGPSGQIIRKDTTLLHGPASSDCKTITVPVNDLSSGKWSFKLYYTSDKYEGVSDEVSFEI